MPNLPETTRCERCPLCRKPATAPHAPFCSAVCRDRDLLNWLGERYAVPAPAVDDASED
jgi:uncharacterized protein